MKPMKNKEIVKYITSGKMPDIEQVRANCLNYEDGKTATKNKELTKRTAFKPMKIIATAAAFTLVIGLINIQAVIAFFSGLFFVPGVGITEDSSITYYGLENPITLKMDSGSVTVEFVTKVTKNGKTELSLYIDSRDNFVSSADSQKAVLGISAGGEAIVSDEQLNARHGITTGTPNGTYDETSVTYYYSNKDFPDINEFDLTFCGIETRVSLIEQAGNVAISQENHGVTFAAYKFSGVHSMFAVDVHDKFAGDEYLILPMGYMQLYDENGDEILLSGGGNEGSEYKMLIRLDKRDREREVKSIKMQRAELQYVSINLDNNRIEIPVPKDGETIKTDIEIQICSHIFKITEVRREGDIIYYENNAYMMKHPDGGFTYMQAAVFDHESAEYKRAVENDESYITATWFRGDLKENKEAQMAGGEIWDFDAEADILVFNLTSADIIQYGNFDITFD
jgi:hypothetical protein